MRGLGSRPDPPDARDHDALKVIRSATPPPRVGRSAFTKTLDQGALGSCTANAGAQIIRAEEVAQLVDRGMSLEEAQVAAEFLARLFAYFLQRAVTHETKIDAGSYMRLFFQVCNTFGFPPESVWTYSDVTDPARDPKFAKMPSSEAYRRAFDQRLDAEKVGTTVVKYSRVPGTGNERVLNVKRALADGATAEHGARRLIAFGTEVSNAFCSDMSANGGKPIDPPVGDIAGGHAMVMGGYDENGVDILNSWSEEFGDAGWCMFSWDYIASDMTRDLWIAERAPLISG